MKKTTDLVGEFKIFLGLEVLNRLCILEGVSIP